MTQVYGDIWEYYNAGATIVITTNGSVRRDGCAVMGRGVALEAKKKLPGLDRLLGNSIYFHGNNVHWFPSIRIVTFPVKHSWDQKADLGLIEESARQLREKMDKVKWKGPMMMVRPGCGNGGLEWKDVKPVIVKWLTDSRVIIVERN